MHPGKHILRSSLLGFSCRNVPLLHHCHQNPLLAPLGISRRVNGIETGVLRDRSQQRTLREIQRHRGFAKVHTGRCIHAVRQIAIKVRVEIPLQNLRLAKTIGSLSRNQQFAELALVSGFRQRIRRKNHILDELLCDCAATLNEPGARFRLQDALRPAQIAE